MKNFSISAVALTVGIAWGSQASACPSAMQAIDACQTWNNAQDAPLDGQPKRGQDDPAVSCVLMASRTPSILLVYEGVYVPNVDTAGVEVITRFRHVSDWKQHDNGVWTKMVCIEKSWMSGIDSFTICGDSGHYHFNVNETGYFKQQSGALTENDTARMWQGG